MVKFLNLVAWVSERLSQFAIIAENKEAFGVKVKSTNVGEVVKTWRK